MRTTQAQVAGLLALVLGVQPALLQSAPAPAPRAKPRLYPREIHSFGSLGGVDAVAFSPDGTRVAAGVGCQLRVYVWDVKTKERVLSLPKPSGWSFINSVTYSADGKILAAGGGAGSGLPADDAPVVLWDAKTGRRLRGLGKPGWTCRSFAFAPDSKTGTLAGEWLQVFDIASGQQVWKADAPNVWGVAFSPNGKLLATLDLRHTVILWEAKTGKRLAELGGGQRNIAMFARLAFAPDGLTLAVRNPDRSVDLWDVPTRKRTRRLLAPQPRLAPKKEVFSHSYVVFSADGAMLASGEYGRTGGILALYEVATGKELQQLGEQTHGFTCAAFAPDSSLLATGSIGGAVHLFGAAPAKQDFLHRQSDPPSDRKLRPRRLP
jgi:WD40 repeat protein